MSKKVTIQDIADALGISRNTVSKAINNSAGIAEATRQRVLQKAVEMGYKQFSYFSSLNGIRAVEEKTEPAGEIAIFICGYIAGNHFAALFLDKVIQELERIGFTAVFYRVSRENLSSFSLPRNFDKNNVRAILCIEMFNSQYCDFICSLDVPILFVDGPVMKGRYFLNADLLMMNNYSEIMRFVHDSVGKGLTRVGFIGDYLHCASFYERFCAFQLAMANMNTAIDERFIIRITDRDTDELADRLDALESYPDIFICTNDFTALDAMLILEQTHPEEAKKIRFLGFDDSAESRLSSTPLSTVHIHTQTMAYSAMHLLLSRIEEPDLDHRILYVATDLILRESTEF